MEVENYSDLPQDRLLELLNQRDDELKTLRAVRRGWVLNLGRLVCAR